MTHDVLINVGLTIGLLSCIILAAVGICRTRAVMRHITRSINVKGNLDFTISNEQESQEARRGMFAGGLTIQPLPQQVPPLLLSQITPSQPQDPEAE